MSAHAQSGHCGSRFGASAITILLKAWTQELLYDITSPCSLANPKTLTDSERHEATAWLCGLAM